MTDLSQIVQCLSALGTLKCLLLLTGNLCVPILNWNSAFLKCSGRISVYFSFPCEYLKVLCEPFTQTNFAANFFYVKGSHRPRPLTRLRRSLIDKTPPITLIRTRRMRIDELVCIMAVGDRWRSFLLLSVKPQGRNKMCIGLTVYPIL